MEPRITAAQLDELEPPAQKRLASWFESTIMYDNEPVMVYIPEERGGTYRGEFSGLWGDSSHEFIYPDDEYGGKLKNHEGTILPLLTIGQMIQFLHEQDNVDLAYRLHNLTHMPRGIDRWEFMMASLLPSLWEGTKITLENYEEENNERKEPMSTLTTEQTHATVEKLKRKIDQEIGAKSTYPLRVIYLQYLRSHLGNVQAEAIDLEDYEAARNAIVIQLGQLELEYGRWITDAIAAEEE